MRYKIKDKTHVKVILDQDIFVRFRAVRCDWCPMILDSGYVYIVETLEKKGLLPWDYQKLCCDCYKYLKLIKEEIKEIRVVPLRLDIGMKYTLDIINYYYKKLTEFAYRKICEYYGI